VNYDLIGDIHGHSEPLVELLEKLGYVRSNGIYRQSERQVIFLGRSSSSAISSIGVPINATSSRSFAR
jgi:hypothetical protein